MFSTDVKVRVRYAETDQMGYVYYGNYLTYYEVARVEALRQLGVSYSELEQSGVMLPVLESHSKYWLPGKYDEELKVKVTIPELPKLKIRFIYEIFNGKSDLIHHGETTLVFINMKTGRPVRMPEMLGKLLKPYFCEETNNS